MAVGIVGIEVSVAMIDPTFDCEASRHDRLSIREVLVIILDGLDECEEKVKREKTQCDIVKMIQRGGTSEEGSSPRLAVLQSSRGAPEALVFQKSQNVVGRCS